MVLVLVTAIVNFLMVRKTRGNDCSGRKEKRNCSDQNLVGIVYRIKLEGSARKSLWFYEI